MINVTVSAVIAQAGLTKFERDLITAINVRDNRHVGNWLDGTSPVPLTAGLQILEFLDRLKKMTLFELLEALDTDEMADYGARMSEIMPDKARDHVLEAAVQRDKKTVLEAHDVG